MTHQVSHMEDVITQFRQMLPTQTATAKAIDSHEPWDGIAMKAVDDGYIDDAADFVRFVEVCTRRST
jgi:hypothetical protein